MNSIFIIWMYGKSSISSIYLWSLFYTCLKQWCSRFWPHRPNEWCGGLDLAYRLGVEHPWPQVHRTSLSCLSWTASIRWTMAVNMEVVELPPSHWKNWLKEVSSPVSYSRGIKDTAQGLDLAHGAVSSNTWGCLLQCSACWNQHHVLHAAHGACLVQVAHGMGAVWGICFMQCLHRTSPASLIQHWVQSAGLIWPADQPCAPHLAHGAELNWYHCPTEIADHRGWVSSFPHLSVKMMIMNTANLLAEMNSFYCSFIWYTADRQKVSFLLYFLL